MTEDIHSKYASASESNIENILNAKKAAKDILELRSVTR
jgi:hypothetical protein